MFDRRPADVPRTSHHLVPKEVRKLGPINVSWMTPLRTVKNRNRYYETLISKSAKSTTQVIYNITCLVLLVNFDVSYFIV